MTKTSSCLQTFAKNLFFSIAILLAPLSSTFSADPSTQPIPVQLDGDPGGYLLPRGAALPSHHRRIDRQDGPGSGTHREGTPPIAGNPAEWTVEILPAALKVLTQSVRGGERPARAPLASDDVA